MSLHAVILSAQDKPLYCGREVRLDRCSWSAWGGAEAARLILAYDGLTLEDRQNLLGLPVEVCDRGGQAVWWGYVSAVGGQMAGVRQTLDLESVANRVCAVFKDPNQTNGLIWTQTAWVEDAQSQASYGVKEKVARLGVTSLAQAQQVSARFLRDNAWPLVRAEEKLITFSKQGERGEFQGIEIRCRGWFHTLGWRTWFNQTGAAMTSDAALGEIFAACGQKLGGLYQEAASGVTITPFTPYPVDGLTAFKGYLKLGQVNLRPMLAWVTSGRLLKVYEQPDKERLIWRLTEAGRLEDSFGNEPPEGRTPAGEWLAIGKAEPVWINYAEWSETDQKMNLRF